MTGFETRQGKDDAWRARVGKYDPEEIETKWQKVWAEQKTFVVDNPAAGLACRAARAPTPPTCSRCSRILRAARTWGTSRTTPWATSSPGSAATRASGCCIPWATTPSGSTPRTWPSRPGSRRPSSPKRPSPPSTGNCAAWACPSTGPARWSPPGPSTTSGPSGSSCSSTRRAWPTRKRRRSTGARRARPCWPTSR